MRKSTYKIITIILVFLTLVIGNFSYVYAGSYSVGNIFKDAQDFVSSGEDPHEMIDTDALKDTSKFIYKILFSIGLVVAIAVGMYLGIQFMVASAEDKAEVKKGLIAYCAGCLVLFGAFGIWKLVINTMKNVTTTTESSSGSGGGSGGPPSTNPYDPNMKTK